MVKKIKKQKRKIVEDANEIAFRVVQESTREDRLPNSKTTKLKSTSKQSE